MSTKKPTDLVTTDDDSEGGSGRKEVENYSTILRRLGIDVKDMSLEDIQNMIHEYSQEGLLKGAKIIDIKTGKAKQTTRKKSEERTYHVKQDSSHPMSPKELADKKDADYNKRSDKDDKNDPQPPFNPTPRAPV